MTETIDRADAPHPGGPRRRSLTYDVRRNDAGTDPVLFMIAAASPMGAAGFGALRDALQRPHRRDLRPPRCRAQPAHRRRAPRHTPEEHADDLHRLIDGARRRAGRHLRQQRRRGERAWRSWPRTRSRFGPSSRTSLRSQRSCLTATRLSP